MARRDNILKTVFLTAAACGTAHYVFDGADRDFIDSFSIAAATGWGALIGDVVKTTLDERAKKNNGPS